MINHAKPLLPSMKSNCAPTALAAILLALLSISPSKAASEWKVDPAIPNGFGVQLKGDNDTGENLDKLKELGVKWVRRGFLWNAVEKTQGEYTFEQFDRLVKDCKERGLRIVGVVALQNKLYNHPKDEPGRSAYTKYAAALAERYKDYDIVWELWNEPNTMTFWGKHGPKGNSEPYAEEYLSLVKATVPAMRKADPDCLIMGGSGEE